MTRVGLVNRGVLKLTSHTQKTHASQIATIEEEENKKKRETESDVLMEQQKRLSSSVITKEAFNDFNQHSQGPKNLVPYSTHSPYKFYSRGAGAASQSRLVQLAHKRLLPPTSRNAII